MASQRGERWLEHTGSKTRVAEPPVSVAPPLDVFPPTARPMLSPGSAPAAAATPCEPGVHAHLSPPAVQGSVELGRRQSSLNALPRPAQMSEPGSKTALEVVAASSSHALDSASVKDAPLEAEVPPPAAFGGFGGDSDGSYSDDAW